MSAWDEYPQDYRTSQVQSILSAVQAGESVALVGLSGSGKSNLLGYLAHRWGRLAPVRWFWWTATVWQKTSGAGFFRLVRAALGDQSTAADELGCPGSTAATATGRSHRWVCCWTASMLLAESPLTPALHSATCAPCAMPTNMT